MTSFEQYKKQVAAGQTPVSLESMVVPKEARDFQGMRAGVISRVIANAIDAVLVGVFLVGAYLFITFVRFAASPVDFTWQTPSWGIVLIASGLTLGTYYWVLWATTGRTYGDHVMGLRVVNYKGERLRWFGALLRSAFCVVFMLGILWVAVSHKNRSVQDIVLRTSVIYDWQPRTVKTFFSSGR